MTKPEDNDNEISNDTEALRADVERMRERVSQDVEALGTKLSPENLKAEAKQTIKDTVQRGTDQVREQVSSAGNSVVSFARSNPVPLALIGVGVGWLVWSARSKRNGRRHTGMDYSMRGRAEVYDGAAYEAIGYEGSAYDRAGYDEDGWADVGSSVAGGMRRQRHRLRDQVRGGVDKVRGGVDSVKRVASEKASQARDKVQELEHAARDQAVKARDMAEHSFEEQPLLLGAVALGAGIAVGLSIPATESENQLVGRYRDQLFSKASEKISNLRGKAGQIAERSYEAAKETVKTSAHELTDDAAPV